MLHLRVSALAFLFGSAASMAAATTVVGNGGTFTPNGVVTALPGISTYYYVSTAGGISGVGALPGVGGSGDPSNGSTLTLPAFSVSPGAILAFNFNYVTSDGAGFADYAWAQLIAPDDPSFALLLFTARTTPDGNTVPGFGMPALGEGVVLDPAETPIIPGAPSWAQLGGDSGSCFGGPSGGCGYTGWIEASYEFAEAGTFALQFGVTNWNDTMFQSGMAVAGTTIDGVPVDPVAPIPLPAAGWMLLGGLGAMAALRRRRKPA